ncbi:hypothetical protein BFR04_00945 [Gaetbulibacter sp. 4G1]|nr:hypothetical protein [Gaetbulibacter sp. 4G1]PIA79446.1 hypothetical protein BFR04_00945 [Gaetbulibacter sp. 4G1]
MRTAFLVAILFTLTINSQSIDVVKQIQHASHNKASESIYLQTSKDIYETREDLWFKAYVLDSKNLTPSNKSKILFVQLLNNEQDIPVWEEKYEIENGFVNGHLFLQDTLKPGTYTLTAYSANSFYKDSGAFNAVRKIQVLKSIADKPPQSNQKKQDSIFQFVTFPEGGNLVNGIESRLAFKAVNSKGHPVNVSGVLYENGEPLTHFKSTHLGMGSFLFIPNTNKSYHIKLSKKGEQEIYSIPKIYNRGKVMRLISQTKENLIFKVSQNPSLKKETVHIRVQSRGIAYNLATAVLEKNLKIKIPITDLPQGIAEVTLFNKNFEPICERLIYVNLDRKLNIKTSLLKSEYKTRDKGTLKIQVTDENGNPVMAHLSLSIFDRIYKNKQDSKTIESHYFLSTQLKGKLYNPAYYFDEQNKDRKENLDLLLLTQGWRRYVWSETNLEALKHKKQVVFDDITGKATNKEKKKNKDSKLLGTPVINVSNSELKNPSEFILLDSLGMFKVKPNHLKLGERNYVYFKLMISPQQKYLYTINNNWFKSINTTRKTKPIYYPEYYPKNLEEEQVIPFKLYADIKELDEVVLKTKKKRVSRDKYLGKLDSILRLEIIDWIAEPCKTLNCPFHPYEPGNELPVEGQTYSRYVSEYYENNQRKEIRETVVYKKRKITDEYLMSRFNLIRIKGYYGKREFYQPVYDEETINDPFPDYRNTLFWKPDIITNKQGEAIIEFYCSDINTTFLGEIEGVSGDGLLGAANLKFAVRKRKN